MGDDRRARNVRAEERAALVAAWQRSCGALDRMAAFALRRLEELRPPAVLPGGFEGLVTAEYETWFVSPTARDFERSLRRTDLDGLGCAHPRLSTIRQGLERWLPRHAAGIGFGEYGRKGERGLCDMCRGNAHAHAALWLQRSDAERLRADWGEHVGFIDMSRLDVEEAAMRYAAKYMAKDSARGEAMIFTKEFDCDVEFG